MKAELTDLSTCRKAFDIEIPEDIVDREVTQIAQEFARKAKVPGFRPGRAPLSVVKTRYRDDIASEMLQHLLPRYFSDAVKEKDLNVVDAPEYETVEYDNGKPLKFKAVFEVYPELSVSNYKEIPTEEPSAEVSDSDVEGTLKKLQDDMSELTPIQEERGIKSGDFADISFTGKSDEQEEPLFSDKATVEVGGETTLKEFTENLDGGKMNEDKSFSVTYREDYPEKRLAGKTIHYNLKIESIKEKKVPALDDEFAQGIGEYKTLEELRTKVRADMEKHKREHANEELREKLLVWLENNNEFEVPATLVARQTQIRLQQLLRNLSRQGINPQRLDVDWAKIREEQSLQAVRDVKGSLLLDYVAEKENISTTEQEVEDEIDRIAGEQNVPRQKVKDIFSKDSGLSRLRGQIQNKKTLDFLQQHARVQTALAKD